MLKNEVQNYLREKFGYLPFPHLFEIFNEHEQIPDYIINYDPNKQPKSEFELVKQLFDIL